MRFFDKYPEFISEGSTGVFGNRLNHRYRAIIEHQKEVFPNASVLDLASHDGRWSLAALECGAASVTGIEARPDLAHKSQRLLAKYGYGSGRFDVIVDDCLHALDDLEPNRYDIVLCLGFFYHTIHHFRLLTQIRRLNPGLIILDGLLSTDDFPGVLFRLEDSTRDGTSVQTAEDERDAIVGIATIDGLEMMLRHLGLRSEFIDWHHLGLPDWDGVEDYLDWEGVQDYLKGRRYTILVRSVA